jgi:hypothetical protein
MTIRPDNKGMDHEYVELQCASTNLLQLLLMHFIHVDALAKSSLIIEEGLCGIAIDFI